MVKINGWPMATRERSAKKEKAVSTPLMRATISFPPNAYRTLEQIARNKKVSLAWVVREAVDAYLAEKWPLFKRQLR